MHYLPSSIYSPKWYPSTVFSEMENPFLRKWVFWESEFIFRHLFQQYKLFYQFTLNVFILAAGWKPSYLHGTSKLQDCKIVCCYEVAFQYPYLFKLLSFLCACFRTPSFSTVTNSNCVDLPACFFLKLNRPMPFSLAFIQRMANATCECTSLSLCF